MAVPLKQVKRSYRIQAVLDTLFKVIMSVAIVFLANGYLQQREERNCRFDLTTETDKVDSDIAAKQAEIFEAAILRPSPEGQRSEELIRLGAELHTLLELRVEAYERRDDAVERCD